MAANPLSPPRTPSREDHPVWQVYDLLRTTRLNELYYAEFLSRLKRRQWWMEVGIAVTTPGAAAVALVLGGADAAWLPQAARDTAAPYMTWMIVAWLLLAGVATILALVKPLTRIGESISNVEGCHVEYRSIAADLGELRSEIRHRLAYDDELRSWFLYIRRRRKIACEREPRGEENAKLKLKLEARIERELPADSFYVPEEPTNG